MEKRNFFLILMIFTVTVICISCTNFFSTSLASWASRDPDRLIPKVTTGNIDELLALAENNPDLSFALLKKIASAASGASGDAKDKLQNAAMEAAVNSVGLGQAIIGSASDLGSIQDDSKEIIIDAINGMKNLDKTASLLTEILADGFDADADPNNLALAAVVLLAAQAKADGDPETYINNFSPGGHAPGSPEKLAEDMAAAAKAHPDASGPLKDLLDSLNLT